MAGDMGSFIMGIENLSFVERLSDQFAAPPRTVVRVIGAVAGIAIILLLVAAIGHSEQQAEETLVLEGDDSLAQLPTEFDNDVSTASPTARGEAAPQSIIVYVTGAVESPGLYTLKGEERIGDAVEAAGGLLPEAATAVVNLAQQVTDGMQVHIPRTDEVQHNEPSAGVAGVPANTGAEAGGTGSLAPVNINTADSASLQTLDGIGPATAQKILDYRSAHGAFQSKEELKNVSGIGDKKYAAIEARITV